jgi:type IV pilus assembly protein PilX
MKNLRTTPIRNRQDGAALVISLILLLILTVIGMSAIQTTTTEERMAGNMRDTQIAFQSAEAVMRDAEQFIEGTVATSAFNDSNGLFNNNDSDGTAEPDYTATSTWTSSSTSRAYSLSVPGIPAANQPRYFIKHIGAIEIEQGSSKKKGTGKVGGPGTDVELFRITVKGFGASGKSQVILRSHYGKRY